ncbi:MAG TPA: hypothetical protein VGB55_04995 [Tepidisphaeraceae bacterium]|jgi:hypothetical protein
MPERLSYQLKTVKPPREPQSTDELWKPMAVVLGMFLIGTFLLITIVLSAAFALYALG